MGRRFLLVFFLVFLMSQPLISSSNVDEEIESIINQELVWSRDLGTGYISTSPIVHDDSVLVRLSGSFSSDSVPSISSFDFEGNLLWSVAGERNSHPDMSPLMIISPGQGNCGNWNEMLAVAWANGTVETLNISTGEKIWSMQTSVVTWGITGQMQQEGDRLVVPTRNGIDIFCLANGALLESYSTDLGWRNGVSIFEDMYLIGDETGKLWIIQNQTVRNQTFPQFSSIDNPKIRHSPTVFGDKILVIAQGTSNSRALILNYSSSGDFSVQDEFLIGQSPSIPQYVSEESVLIGSSNGLQLVGCGDECVISEPVGSNVNGEIFFQNGIISTPENSEDGEWIFATIHNNSLVKAPSPSIQISGWGTAGPAQCGNYWWYGNDLAILEMYYSEFTFPNSCKQEIIEPEKIPTDKTPGIISLLLISAFLVFCFATYSLGIQSGVKYSLPLVLISLILLSPYVVSLWSQSSLSEPTKEVWDEDWPESWKGQQVISFEFEDEVIAIGGIGTFGNVSEATISAADELNLSLEIEQTNLGNYLVSINGETGNGWEFYVDGNRGLYSIDEVRLEQESVLVWRPA